MKYLLILLSCCFIVSCCSHSEQHQGEIKTTQKAILKYQVNEQGEIINENCGCGEMPYSVYVVNGCEYIYLGYGQSSWGGHSGTCPNPIHQYNPEQVLADTSTINF